MFFLASRTKLILGWAGLPETTSLGPYQN